MLLNKSLLLLVTFIFAIVSAQSYTEFKISGTNPMNNQPCNSTAVYTVNNGACQNVCGMFGKLITTSDSTKFDVQMYLDQNCASNAIQSSFTCLPDLQPVKINPSYNINVTCIAEVTPSPTPSDSSATSIIASFSAVFIALLFALL
ncbi:hypothetical protein ACTA71_010375 [Dictyostelium dimigraforme]